MLKRKIADKINNFLNNKKKKALLITGARQIGKTYIIREVGKQFDSFIEINFLENKRAIEVFKDVSTSKDILLRLSAFIDKPLVEDRTLIFFDEIQEIPDIVTAIKFLVEEGSYNYILSGSLLGVELKDIRSMPVGYMDIIDMYPLDFEEFAIANGVSAAVLKELQKCYEEKKVVDPLIHNKMIELFKLYLVVGGMPEVVNTYLETNNIQKVIEIQKSIITLYKKDISKYDKGNKLYIENIFNLIPGELNNQNRRFILKKLNDKARFSKYENSFLWLKEAGVALPVYVVDEPVVPLMISMNSNLFKLFLCDIGLLSAMYMDGIQLKILMGELNINNGAIYENFAAIELQKNGFNPYYLNNRKIGELDFLVEKDGKVLPIELKSGKQSESHTALNNMLRIYKGNGLVFHDKNTLIKDQITYYPIYMIMFLKKEEPIDLIYKIDLTDIK